MSYIGETIRTFYLRYNCTPKWWEQVDSPYLHNALEYYGHQNFQIDILEYGHKSLEHLFFLESVYAALFNTYVPNGYNIAKCGQGGGNVVKEYDLRNPNGEIIHVKNLMAFARENNLEYSSILRVSYGESLSHKGWTNINIDPKQIDNLRWKSLAKTYQFINPKNELVIVTNIRKFARENNLCCQSLFMVASGKQLEHKGYILPTTDRSKIKPRYSDCANIILHTKDGEVVHINNLSRFCREKGLKYGKMNSLKNNKIGEYDQYVNPNFKPKPRKFPKGLKLKREYELLSPDNEIIKFNNKQKFSKEVGISVSTLDRVLKDNTKDFRGWHRKDYISPPLIIQETKIMKREPIKRGKSYTLLSPENEIVEVFNLRKFCIERNLNENCMRRIVREERFHYKNWRKAICNTIFDFNKRGKEYIIISPKGEQIKIKNLSKFCRENQINLRNMHSVKVGKRNNCKGWKLIAI